MAKYKRASSASFEFPEPPYPVGRSIYSPGGRQSPAGLTGLTAVKPVKFTWPGSSKTRKLRWDYKHTKVNQNTPENKQINKWKTTTITLPLS